MNSYIFTILISKQDKDKTCAPIVSLDELNPLQTLITAFFSRARLRSFYALE